MAEIIYSPALAQVLQGKVIVITGMPSFPHSPLPSPPPQTHKLTSIPPSGGAQGIGAATVTLLHSLGAHVVFGDWSDAHGRALESSLQSTPSSSSSTSVSPAGTAIFTPLDVRSYQSQLSLFDNALQKHGRIDAAISCAAVKEPSGFFEPQDLNLTTVRDEPTAINEAMNINLTSVLSFARIALAYLPHSPATSSSNSNNNSNNGSNTGTSEGEGHKERFTPSITLVSSIAGITEAPGLFAYSAAKHGVIGLMRALRPWAPVKYGVRANAICPWATDTQLLAGVKERW